MKEPFILSLMKYRLIYHIAWETRDHRLILEGKAKKELDRFLEHYEGDLSVCTIVDYFITLHHVHLVLRVSPESDLDNVIDSFKQVTNILLESRFHSLVEDVYGKNTYVWSPGYYVSTLQAESEDNLKDMREQWLKEPQEPGSPAVKAIEAQPK